MRVFGVLISVMIMSVLSSKLSMTRLKGRLPAILPPPMRSNIEGTWAYDTMSRRVITDIMRRIIEDNESELVKPTSPLRSECFLLLNDLKSSLECGRTGFLRGLSDNGPDVTEWDRILSTLPEEERNWLDAPWVITEFYLYRRIVEAFRFFDTGYDMFVKQKVQGLVEATSAIDEIATKLPTILGDAKAADALAIAIQTSLWGNKMDLSLWPAGISKAVKAGSAEVDLPGQISFGSTLVAGKKFILDDRTSSVVTLLEGLRAEKVTNSDIKVGIVIDNAGYELFSDMLLGHFLLELNVASTVVFYTKGHPTFISDATTEDASETIGFLSSSPFVPTSDLGKQFASHVSEGKFVFDSDLFWCQPTAFWDMPESIQEKVEECRLVFVKGDANYRRLLGEREWPLDTTASEILSYWPVPVCALRTFKAEIGCGISLSQVRETQNADPSWMVSGRWGVVQLGGEGS